VPFESESVVVNLCDRPTTQRLGAPMTLATNTLSPVENRERRLNSDSPELTDFVIPATPPTALILCNGGGALMLSRCLPERQVLCSAVACSMTPAQADSFVAGRDTRIVVVDAPQRAATAIRRRHSGAQCEVRKRDGIEVRKINALCHWKYRQSRSPNSLRHRSEFGFAPSGDSASL